MRHISNELSQRARAIARRDGYYHDDRFISTGQQYVDTGVLMISVDDLDVLRVQDSLTTETIMVEGPIGTLIETSPDEVLDRALAHLRQRMVLEDLSDV
jgi:hypothetical protein